MIFGFVETKVAEPLFRLSLLGIRAFAAGDLANFMVALGRSGMQFMLIIWLQGIWLPLHGYSFSRTPLWAGIYLSADHRLPRFRAAVRCFPYRYAPRGSPWAERC